MFERPAPDRPRLTETLLAVRPHHLANAVVAFLFASTGPVALILTIGIAGGLSTETLSSWIFIGFAGGGAITFAMSWFYKQPLAFAWTISGTAIAGQALLKYPFAEIVGAYMVTGAVMILLGITSGFKAIMRFVPQPIVMAMVAGVFLKFGILAVDAFDKEFRIALAALIAWVVFSFWKPVARFLPPVLMALLAAGYMAVEGGQFALRQELTLQIARPDIVQPVFSKAALLDLVLPLLVSVLALQNAQGIAILRVSGHDPPTNTSTFVCGAGSLLFAAYSSVNTCMTGPTNAILASSGAVRFHFVGAYLWAALAIAFGLLSPVVTRLALSVPESFIYIIGGLAMLPVLQQAFTAGFGGRFAIGATVSLVVTVTDLIPGVDVNLLGIGAPFWGLVFGAATSLLLERGDYAELIADGNGAPAPRGQEQEEAAEPEAAPPKALSGPGPGRTPADIGRLPDGPVVVISPAPGPDTSRVLIALREKGLACRLVEDMTWRPGEGVSENPLNRNPLVRFGAPNGEGTGEGAGESVAFYDPRTILDYLETVRPVPALMPPDPAEVFEVKTWEALTEGVNAAAVDLYIAGARNEPAGDPGADPDWIARRRTRIRDGLATAASLLGDRPFAVGAQFTRGDIALAAMLAHLDRLLPGEDWRAAHPALAAWFDEIRKRGAVAGVLEN